RARIACSSAESTSPGGSDLIRACTYVSAAKYIRGSRRPEIFHSVRSMSHATPQPRTSRTDAGHLIAALAERLQVPFEQVDEIYWEQVDRLAADARIHDFLVVLALRNA